MNINPVSIQQYAGCLPLVRSCDAVLDGSWRLSTPFRHPEGGNIDLFLLQTAGLFSGWSVSDYGMTQAHLLDLRIKPWATAARREIIDQVCRSYDVQRDGGEFLVHIDDIKRQLHDAVIRLGMACMRISDICFTRRFRLSGTFRDDVEEFIESLDHSYEERPLLSGRYGEDVKLDFLVRGRSTVSLVDSVSAMSPTTMHGALETSFCKWNDISNHKNEYNFVTLIDSNCGITKRADTRRLEDVSTVLFFPADAKSLESVLTA